MFVAPSWGDALRASLGLDLRRTTPPVIEIVDAVLPAFRRHKVILAVQLHETNVADSIEEVASRCDWTVGRTSDIDVPGRNHGLLLGTLGWAP